MRACRLVKLLSASKDIGLMILLASRSYYPLIRSISQNGAGSKDIAHGGLLEVGFGSE